MPMHVMNFFVMMAESASREMTALQEMQLASSCWLVRYVSIQVRQHSYEHTEHVMVRAGVRVTSTQIGHVRDDMQGACFFL